MTIARDDVAAYLITQFSSMALSVGQDVDPIFGYATDIDFAYRKLGVARADLATATVEDSDEELLLTLAEYYAARRFWRQLGDRINHTMGETTFNFDGQRKQAEAMMLEAKKALLALGIDVSGLGWSVSALNLDWVDEVTA